MKGSSSKQDDPTTDTTEMMYLERQEQTSDDGAQSPALDRHVLRTPDCTLETSQLLEVGSVYEIDNTKLPPRSPIHLKSIRAVMVSEKTELNVTVRFPSMISLSTCFSGGTCGDLNEKYPPLDGKFVMGLRLARQVLFRRIPAEEFDEQRESRRFWFVQSNGTENISSPATSGVFGDVVSKKGTCWSELRYRGMVQWGIRRQVKFIGKHRENNPQDSSANAQEEDEEEEEEEEEVEKPKEEGDEEAATGVSHEDTTKNRKRKRHGYSRVQKVEAAKREKQRQICAYSKSRQKTFKNSKDRWSAERYKLAEESMLEILRAKGAAFGNPILRPELRSEARKKIGDTGLLDHLLKHMAGKLAPGGSERFRRRHNADGAMEYWLESADLVNIRREAGVQDPYWTPPPGWKPGDNPSQDPICAKELKQLKEEMAKMKRDMQELISKREEESLGIPNSSAAKQNMDHDISLLPLKDMYKELLKRKAKIEEQLMEISHSLSGMEVEMTSLTSTMEESRKSESVAVTRGLDKQKEEEDDRKRAESMALAETLKQAGKEKDKAAILTVGEGEAREDKAARRHRLKSGFRICKPQGTFLWPNSTSGTKTLSSSQLVVQVEDLLVVPTPPSVSSATTSAPPLFPPPPPPPPQPQPFQGYGPSSPVRPLAERRAVTVTVSTVARTLPELGDDASSAVTTDNTGSKNLINLNEVPTITAANHTVGSRGTFSCQPLHSVTATPNPPRSIPCSETCGIKPWESVGGGSRGLGSGELIRYYQQKQQQHRGCSSPCVPSGGGTWLALATPSSSMDSSNRG